MDDILFTVLQKAVFYAKFDSCEERRNQFVRCLKDLQKICEDSKIEVNSLEQQYKPIARFFFMDRDFLKNHVKLVEILLAEGRLPELPLAPLAQERKLLNAARTQ